MHVSHFMVPLLAVSLTVFETSVAVGQDFPSKPIRIITTSAGGGNDVQTRIIAPLISSLLGQPVIVDNRSASLIAAEALSKAPPDGHSLLYNGQSTWLNPLLQKVPYDMRDFAPVAQVTREIYILTVHPSLPVKSVKDLVALAKSRPGQLNYGSSGAGTGGHLAGELFKSLAGVNILWVPYKGISPAITAQVSGEVQMSISSPGAVLPQLQAGRLRALGITSATPSTLFPNLPTIMAAGVPDFEMISMTGIFAPAKTPAVVVNRVNQELVRTLSRQDVKEKFLNAGVEVTTGSPEQFASAVKADASLMGKVIKEANIRIE